MKSLNSASGLATIVTFYVGLGLLAEVAQIPALKMLVHALSLMTAEQMVFDILKRNGTPAEKSSISSRGCGHWWPSNRPNSPRLRRGLNSWSVSVRN